MFKTSLNICMIVKNEADNLKQTLPSLVAGCSRVIVVDTGSTDDTKETAKALGAEVFDYEWSNDFSAARNNSIAHADSDWIAWFDADELIEEQDLKKLRDHLDRTAADTVHVVVKECPYGTKEAYNSYYRDKVFRNNKGFQFTRPINEQVSAPSDSMPEAEKYDGISLYHWGRNLPEEKMKNKNAERARLFEKVSENNPSDPVYLLLLGMRYLDLERFVEAEETFNKVISVCSTGIGLAKFIREGAHLGKAWTAFRFQDHEKAAGEAMLAIECNADNAEGYCIAAGSLLSMGRIQEAFALLEKAVSLPKKQHPVLPSNDLCWNVMRHLFYANCLVSEKRYSEAIPHLETVKSFQPENESASQLLGLLKKEVEQCRA